MVTGGVKWALGPRTEYVALASDDDLTESNFRVRASGPSFRTRYVSLLEQASRLVCSVMFVSGIWMLVTSRNIQTTKPTDKECAAQISVWSPLIEAVEYEERNFENYFSHKSPFRGPPTTEIEQSWKDLSEFPSVLIPPSRLPYLNRSIEQGFVPAVASSSPGYIGGIEVFHQLHCLNMIRQFTWLDHYGSPPQGFEAGPVMNRMHVDHCIETVRLALMCNADITPYLLYQDPERKVGIKSDFSAFHKCKRWDMLTDWMKENSFTQTMKESVSGLSQHHHGQK